jgi:hypothetical protein
MEQPLKIWSEVNASLHTTSECIRMRGTRRKTSLDNGRTKLLLESKKKKTGKQLPFVFKNIYAVVTPASLMIGAVTEA